jgi:hypothetical protein
VRELTSPSCQTLLIQAFVIAMTSSANPERAFFTNKAKRRICQAIEQKFLDFARFPTLHFSVIWLA